MIRPYDKTGATSKVLKLKYNICYRLSKDVNMAVGPFEIDCMYIVWEDGKGSCVSVFGYCAQKRGNGEK